MADLGEAAGGGGADAFARTVGATKLGEASLDCPVAADERVEIRVGNLRRVLLVVECVVMADLPGQARKLCLGFCLGQLVDGLLRGGRQDANLAPSRRSAAARASSLIVVPESMRAISSRRAAASSSPAWVRLPALPALFSTRQ